jgi:hypothetical protein
MASGPRSFLGTSGDWRLGVSVVLGFAVAGIHRWARRGASGARASQAPLVLLAVVAAMAVQLIGDNTARALSVVSALSVARFRADINAQDAVFVRCISRRGTPIGPGRPAPPPRRDLMPPPVVAQQARRRTPGTRCCEQPAFLSV